jgi:hypothetical protein
MSSYNEDLKLSELLAWFVNHDEKSYKEEYEKKFSELMEILKEIDRINIREFVDNKLTDKTEALV